jgi:hypothetical protein
VKDQPPRRRLLVFARYGKDNSFRVVKAICLSKDAGAEHWVCPVLTKDGKLLTSPEQMLNKVRKRIADGSRVPADCDRERVELPYSDDCYGGKYISPGTPWDSDQEIYHVLVPWVPKKEKSLRR